MIKVIYSLDPKKNYTYLSISGHADSDEYGKDLICASVSSIIFGLMNALDEKEKIKIKESDNHIEIFNESENEVVNNYFELVMFQLKTIEESYAEFLKIERK